MANAATDFGLDPNIEIQSLQKKVSQSLMPNDLKQRSLGMIARLIKMSEGGSFSQEFESVSEYINWIVQIPWGSFSKDNLDIEHVRNTLTQHHYGLDTVKNRILEYLAIMHLRSSENDEASSTSDQMMKLRGSSEAAPILCFVGIQGVGKTSMAKSIASALGRKFVRISLGGLGSVTELRGLSKSEPDSEPGQVIKGLIRTESMNPLILLDEIDKVSSQTGLRADVMAALLEILDPEQNATFMDKYVDFPVDLSKTFFITTANNLGGISAALQDRLEIIRFGSYNDQEKIVIAKDYLLPKVIKASGLTSQQLQFTDDVWELVVRPLGFDAGVRQLERTLSELARKVALQLVQGVTTGVTITRDNFREYIPQDFGVYS